MSLEPLPNKAFGSSTPKLKRTVWVWACHKCRVIIPEDEASVAGWDASEGKPPRCPRCDEHLARMRLDKAETRSYGVPEGMSYRDFLRFRGLGAFGTFCDRILELCNHTFSAMYAKVFEQYWNNSFFARMRCNYCTTNWQEGIYEVYIPTRENMEWNMQYYHIIVKVLPEMDVEAVKAELGRLEKGQITLVGIKDSELIAFIAPHRSQKERLLNTKFRGFRHAPKRGYLTATIITPWPEQAFKRLLTLVSKFLGHRVTKLREKLKLFFYSYIRNNELYYKYNIIENYSLSVTNTLKCLSHSLDWVTGRLKEVFREIGRQNIVKTQIKPAVKRIKEILCFFVETPTYIQNAEIPNPPEIKKLLTVFPVAKGWKT